MASLITMGQSSKDRGGEVHQHSGWLVPLTVMVVTVALSGLVLAYYLAPNPSSFIEAHARPTALTDPVATDIGGLAFKIPANYLIYASDRQGGPRTTLSLAALAPAFNGFNLGQALLFRDHTARSRVVQILIRAENLNLTERDRLSRIYLGLVDDPQGVAGPYGLTEYVFRNDNGYRSEDLFVGQVDGAPVVMRCWRTAPAAPAPDCLRDMRLSKTVAMSYRFKRANLSQWRQIASGVHGMVSGFQAAAK